MYLVHKQLTILGQAREFATIPGTDILAPCAEPQSLVLKVVLLFLAEMASVDIMLTPPIIISFLRAAEISEPQARLRPPHVILGPVDSLQHDGLVEGGE
jgi:hypothetical protein